MTNPLPRPTKVHFELNVPQTMALQYSTSRTVQSRIPGAPNQSYFQLTDGRAMYIPLEIGAQIDALRLKPGEPFTLTKLTPRDWRAQRLEALRQEFIPPMPENGHSPRVNGAGEDCAAILARCYSQAITIAVAAVEAAREQGLMVSPSFEDLRCISTTLLITETGRR